MKILKSYEIFEIFKILWTFGKQILNMFFFRNSSFPVRSVFVINQKVSEILKKFQKFQKFHKISKFQKLQIFKFVFQIKQNNCEKLNTRSLQNFRPPFWKIAQYDVLLGTIFTNIHAITLYYDIQYLQMYIRYY
jgi:hypothetical protein